MLLSLTTWFVLGTLGMAAGTALLVWAYANLAVEHRMEYLAVVAVPLIATVAYALMALDVGGIAGPRGGTLYVPRYVDWLLTTPLHVVYVGLLVGTDRDTLLKLATLQAVTIVLGMAGGLVAAPLNFLLFAAGGAAFAWVVSLLFGDVAATARACDDRTLTLYRKLRNFVVVLWLIYPVIWLLSGPGLALMGTESASLVVTYIDIVAKVGFGLIAFADLQGIETAAPEPAAAAAD